LALGDWEAGIRVAKAERASRTTATINALFFILGKALPLAGLAPVVVSTSTAPAAVPTTRPTIAIAPPPLRSAITRSFGSIYTKLGRSGTFSKQIFWPSRLSPPLSTSACNCARCGPPARPLGELSQALTASSRPSTLQNVRALSMRFVLKQKRAGILARWRFYEELGTKRQCTENDPYSIT
jgi:hypothetical protein